MRRRRTRTLPARTSKYKVSLKLPLLPDSLSSSTQLPPAKPKHKTLPLQTFRHKHSNNLLKMVAITNMLVALVAVTATGVAARKKDCTPNGKLFCGYHLNNGEFGM